MSRNHGVRRLIVGVDPGLNCGLAALTFDGKPILVESRRGWSLDKIIERISGLGEPAIISSDVSPASSLLERLSKKFNAILFEPVISMSADEKHKLARTYIERYNIKVENVHEIDALAAAIKAYQHYKNKFEQVDAKLREIGSSLFPDEVKNLVIRGYSIARAIKALREPNFTKAKIVIKRAATREERMKELIKELNDRLILEKERTKRLKATIRELRSEIKALRGEIERLKESLSRERSEQIFQIRREREYRRLVEEIKRLKDKILEQKLQIEEYRGMLNQIQMVREMETVEGLTLLKPIESFTREGLKKAFKLYDIRVGDLVFILDPSGGGSTTAESLAKRGVSTVIIKGVMAHQALEIFEKYYVPVISADKINIRWIGGLPYADPEEIKRVIREGETVRSSDEFEMVKTILDDYLRELKRQKT